MLASRKDLLEVGSLISRIDHFVCRRPNATDLHGERFVYLVAICRSSKANSWLCVCDCGRKKVVQRSALVCGITKSCGCETNTLLRCKKPTYKRAVNIKIDRDWYANYRSNNKSKFRSYSKKYQSGISRDLTDQYIKRLLFRDVGSYSDIPPELIEAKREHIRVVRLLKGERS